MLEEIVNAYKLWHLHYNNFPRLSKFSLGTKIDSLFTDLIEFILLAGYAGRDQKYTFVVRASTKLDLLKSFMQIAWELNCIDHKQYAAIAVPLNQTGKMIGGWLKDLKTKQPPPNS